MTNTPHELASDFPEHVDKISQLKQKDAHFARLVDAYHSINREVHRAETDVAPTADQHMTDMRKKRMRLKDEIHAILES